MQPRRIARELALLGLSQISRESAQLEEKQLSQMVLVAVRTLTHEINETLETASAELKRGSDRLLGSETRAIDVRSSRTMVAEAIELTQKAINRIGVAVEIPEMIQLANQADVRTYAVEILQAVHRRQVEIDDILAKSLKDWQIDRLPRIDRDILRIAVAEMAFLEIPDRVAINEAIELAKRYSDEEGHRFVNGVLRRVTTCIKESESSLLSK